MNRYAVHGVVPTNCSSVRGVSPYRTVSRLSGTHRSQIALHRIWPWHYILTISISSSYRIKIPCLFLFQVVTLIDFFIQRGLPSQKGPVLSTDPLRRVSEGKTSVYHWIFFYGERQSRCLAFRLFLFGHV